MSRSKRLQALRTIKKECKKKMKHRISPISETGISEQERNWIREIKERTRERNLNNVTRTTAYFDYYLRHPEIHWAFLGHMVSRNGGWNMTDLKGDLLSRLLSETEQKAFFMFLERGNWLIFQDVYPQFLLYEISMQNGVNLFHLLPFFHVSVFMEVMWNYFWKEQDRYLLAIAMVINEQSYLEQRVVQNPDYQKTVLQTLEFKLQDLLGLNQILFPFEESGGLKARGQAHAEIAGMTLHQFASLHERIILGKRLYSLLFDTPSLRQKIFQWAKKHPHTGTRKDYWPHLFNDVNETAPGKPYLKRTEKCRLKKGARRLYSPRLQHAWKNADHPEAEIGDWFEDWKVITYFTQDDIKADGEIKREYCRTLEKIELAVMAQTAFFSR